MLITAHPWVPMSCFLVLILFLDTSIKKRAVSRLSYKAEYKALASTVKELQWIKSLLGELWLSFHQTLTLYSDNLGATYLYANPVFHTHMKHLAIDYPFIYTLVQSYAIRIIHVSTEDQLVDALTKPLPRSKLLDPSDKIGVASGTPS